MKGYSDIAQLHHVFLRRIVVAMEAEMPSMQFSSYFPEINIPTDEATWEIELGGQGISPFVAPGAPAPLVGIDGHTSGSAKVAYWKEKSFLDESLLNNLRKVGTLEGENATAIMGRQLRKLVARNKRRKEWMCARAIIDGQFTYVGPGNAGRFTVNYGRPSDNTLLLADDRKWGSGDKRNPVEDIFDVKTFMGDTYGVKVTKMTINSDTLKLLMFDAKVQDLLKKSNFGDGDLFARPAVVLGTLLGVGELIVNDEMFAVNADILGVNGTEITVDNAADFEEGGKLYLDLAVKRFKGEPRNITKVNKVDGVVTIDAPFSSTPVPGRDRVHMARKYMDDKKVILHTPDFQGTPAGEFYRSPFGIPPHFGMFTDSEPEWDPDGVFVRVQDKGMPVLYSPQASFSLIVA